MFKAIQLHLKYINSIIIGCCYKPPNAKMDYLEHVGQMLDFVTNTNNNICLLLSKLSNEI